MKKILRNISFYLFFLVLLFCFSLPIKILAENKIDINVASLQELDQLARIGPVLAQRIVDSRPFISVDDLQRVKGVGKKVLQKIKDQGLAYVVVDTQHLSQAQGAQINTNTENQAQVETPTPAKIPPITDVVYPNGVVLNEILPSPKGADEQNEFIEIYNTNNFDVDLSDWKIEDTEGVITTFTIPKKTKILANKYFVFKRSETKISMNNSGDTLNLIFPNNKITSFVSFAKAPLGQSYNLANSNWIWSANPTPEKQNTITTVSLKTKTPDINIKIANQENLASLNDSTSLSENTNQNEYSNHNPWFLFIIVLVTATILAIVVLISKVKFFKKESVKTLRE